MYLYSRKVNVGPQGVSFIDVFLLCALIGVSLLDNSEQHQCNPQDNVHCWDQAFYREVQKLKCSYLR